MMKDRQFPGYQNMISASNVDTIKRQHEMHMRHNRASHEDCYIEELQDIPTWDLAFKQGFRSRYRIIFNNYRGWKVYMNHTGCYAMIPEYEDNKQSA